MNFHGGGLSEFALSHGLDIRNIIDFSSNVNYLGPSPKAILAENQRNPRIAGSYPNQTPLFLEKAIADYYDIPPASVFACRGAAEAIFLLTAALRPNRVLIPNPTFSEYLRAAKGWGVESVEILDSPDYLVNLKTALLQAKSGDLVWLCRPNNPTGDLACIETIRDRILDLCAKGVWIASDESFLDFLPLWQDESLAGLAGDTAGLLVLGSLSKLHALPSLRVGWILAHQSMVSELAKIRPPWTFDGFTESVASAALHDSQWQEYSRLKNLESRRQLLDLLDRYDFIRPSEGIANFILATLADDLTSNVLSDHLAKHGIMIRTCEDFSGLDKHHVRFAVKDRPERQRLAEGLGMFSHQRRIHV